MCFIHCAVDQQLIDSLFSVYCRCHSNLFNRTHFQYSLDCTVYTGIKTKADVFTVANPWFGHKQNVILIEP